MSPIIEVLKQNLITSMKAKFVNKTIHDRNKSKYK